MANAMKSVRLLMAVIVIGSLVACSFFRPSEAAMQKAIGDFVVREEDYPREFILPENFVLTNLQKIQNSDSVEYQVQAEFDVTFTADGDVIVAALKLKQAKEHEKEKRRTNNLFEELKDRVTGAIGNFSYESRFKNVRTGDQDHYSGTFNLIRNEDSTWRVSSANYH